MIENVDLTLVDWSRVQFALTAMYHWLFVPLTLGLSFILAIMETIYVKTGKEEWKRLTRFWMTLFGINFAIGIATGIILEFEFGTNWSNYSWFVGDIFGTPLAIEGILAFFLESTFVAVMFFGWNKVSKKFHLTSTWLVAIGAAFATFFTGSRFSLSMMNQVQWATPWYGLEALLNIRNLALGFAVLFLARINGLLYIINTIDDKALIKRSGKKLILNSIPFLLFFLFFVISLLFSTGFAADPATGTVTMEKFKYLQNFLSMPVVLILFLAGVLGVQYGIAITVLKKSSKGIWFTGSGSVLAVLSLLLIAGYNGTAFYPSTINLQNSLTIRNASSSQFTLKTMMLVSLLIPFVLVYIWYAWKAINNKKINEDEMKSDGHVY